MTSKSSFNSVSAEPDLSVLSVSSIEYIPTLAASVGFSSDDSVPVFRENKEVIPRHVGSYKYMPWGTDNAMPYKIMNVFDSDETMDTCQSFNIEAMYAGGLCYHSDKNLPIDCKEFVEDNDLNALFFGTCTDFKFFAFAVVVFVLNKARNKIISVSRREACYCRFAPADEHGVIPYVLYAQWRQEPIDEAEIEFIPLLSSRHPLRDLRNRIKNTRDSKFAMVVRMPTVDHTYYPIPRYASLIKGKWFAIKQLIGKAKEAKLRNTTSVRYQILISKNYWVNLLKEARISDPAKQQLRIDEEKQRMIDFLTGVENSGKAWFSTFYVSPEGKEITDVKIIRIDSEKEGGDWSADIQEAINMICFGMRVHSNLVGSVPGKSQSNNSGSDKRELYTIAQAMQQPYRDMLLRPHALICSFNGWHNVSPTSHILQLTTLDSHKDITASNL